MYPFLNHNGYPVQPFHFNGRYETYREPQADINPYIYHFANPNFSLQHDNPITNHYQSSQVPFFFPRKMPFDQNLQNKPVKKKRITKKIVLTQLKKKIRASHQKFKALRGVFKYFDPSRAPPVTSLRNCQELRMDLMNQKEKGGFTEMIDEKSNQQVLESQMKLQILLRSPDLINYPFLICKKRKYHRNLKRRYSVAYFEQRAIYIVNKEPIPESLHPKNKVRKPRIPKNNGQRLSESFSESSNSSEQPQSQQESFKQFQGNKKANNFATKPKNYYNCKIRQIKEEIESPPSKKVNL